MQITIRTFFVIFVDDETVDDREEDAVEGADNFDVKWEDDIETLRDLEKRRGNRDK